MIEGLFQPTHLIIIVIIALIVLGPAKLGDLGGAMGRSVREFKENVDTGHDQPEPQAVAPIVSRTMLPPEQRGFGNLDDRTAATDGIRASDV